MGSGTSGGAGPFPRVALSCVTVTLRISCGTGKVTLFAENRGDVCLHELQITACRTVSVCGHSPYGYSPPAPGDD